MAAGAARPWAVLGAAGAVASLAVAAALQAVDGVALKGIVDRWAAAVQPEKAMIFQVAVGVRQIEIGLASMISVLVGATFIVYGIAVGATANGREWLAWLGVIGGGGLLVNGVVTAYTGFSSLAMSVNVPSTIALLFWLVALAVRIWRSANAEPRRFWDRLLACRLRSLRSGPHAVSQRVSRASRESLRLRGHK